MEERVSDTNREEEKIRFSRDAVGKTEKAERRDMRCLKRRFSKETGRRRLCGRKESRREQSRGEGTKKGIHLVCTQGARAILIHTGSMKFERLSFIRAAAIPPL